MPTHLTGEIKKYVSFPKLLKFLFFAYFLFVVIYLFSKTAFYFWDFKVYYSAAKCLTLQLNPYSVQDLFKVHVNVAPLPYMYPPLVLFVFKFFTIFNINTAVHIYLILKLVALALLIFIWGRLVPEIKQNSIFFLFAFFAFNSALYTDLYTGNISVFEQLFIWTGIYFLLKNDNLKFAVCILIASMFKILPVVFLLFILFSKNKQRHLIFTCAAAVFIIYLLMNQWILPDLTHHYLVSFSSNVIREGGITNPNSYELIKDISFLVSLPPFVTKILYVSMVFVITGIIYGKVFRRKDILFSQEMVFLLCLTVIIMLPRFKDYSYILAVLPVYARILKMKEHRLYYILIILLSISAYHVELPGFSQVMNLVWEYYPLLIVLVFWRIYLNDLKKKSSTYEKSLSMDQKVLFNQE